MLTQPQSVSATTLSLPWLTDLAGLEATSSLACKLAPAFFIRTPRAREGLSLVAVRFLLRACPVQWRGLQIARNMLLGAERVNDA